MSEAYDRMREALAEDERRAALAELDAIVAVLAGPEFLGASGKAALARRLTEVRLTLEAPR